MASQPRHRDRRAATRPMHATMSAAMTPTRSRCGIWSPSVCFILALKGLSHPQTARRGNLLGIIGMAIAVLVTLALVYSNTKNVGRSSAASRSAARSAP